MRIDLSADPGLVVLDIGEGGAASARVIIRRGEAVLGEIAVGTHDGPEVLWQEVVRARRLEALPHLFASMVRELTRDRCLPDHVNKGPKAQREAFYGGLVDGLQLRTVAHLDAVVPPILPHHSPSYRDGYASGEAIARTVAAVFQAARGESAA